MSHDLKNRFFNKSPLPKPTNFSAFLEPNPHHSHSPINTFSTRTESPSNKSIKGNRISAAGIASKLELTEKQNLMLQERNKVLSKEKQILQKKLTRDKVSPNNTFKDHAVALIKQTYLKNPQNSKDNLKNIQEKITNLKKLINWIASQPADTELKFLKNALDDIQNNFKGFELEFEAKLAFMEQSHEIQIRKLEKIIHDLEQRQEHEAQDTLSVLIKKNNELLKNSCTLFQQNEEFKKNIKELQDEIIRLQKPEVQKEMQEKMIEEFKVQVYLGKKKEDQEIVSSLIDLETRFVELKKHSLGLEDEIKKKNGVIDRCYKEIAELKLRNIKGKAKDECFSREGLRSFSVERSVRNSESYKKEDNELVPLFSCLAAALEEFLI